METETAETLKAAPKIKAKFIQEIPRSHNRVFRLFRLFFLILVLGGLVGIGIFITGVINNLPPLDVIENPHTDLSTQIFSADGELIRSLYSQEHRISVKLSEISPHVLNALIATEDIRFYQHSGIDPEALFAVARDALRGRKRGGSTVTMQLSRNLYDQVGRDRTIIRKVKEMIVSVILERSFTKEEIIAAYLNTVSFVGNTYGVQNGAQEYFRKDAEFLTIEEAALLVGMLKGTNSFNPRKYPEKSRKRRNTILNQMERYGFIEDEYDVDSLKALPLTISEKSDYRDLGMASYFTEHLRQWLKGWCKENGYDLYKDGLKVYTTIDSRMQAHAEASVKEHLTKLQGIFNKHIDGREPWIKDTTFLHRAMRKSYRYIDAKRRGLDKEDILKEFRSPIPMDVFNWNGEIKDTLLSPWDSLMYYAKFLETGFMAMDPANGHIKAWVGGIGHKYFKYDHVYKGKRQVGSTFKPFVYASGFDNGLTPCDLELNQPVFFYDNKGKMIWSPKNADGKIGGYMTLRRGLATSTNMITARVMKRIGPQLVCEWARKMGIQSELDCVPSLALGTTDLSVFELTGAYCTFVNSGVWNEPLFVTRIEDQNGNVLDEFNTISQEAIREDIAYMMIDMLKGVVDEPGGTGGRLRSRFGLRNEMGGKTGTTQNHSDGWFMGVTPYLVGGTWVGCSDRTMRFRSLRYGQGASLALPVFGGFMKKVYADSTIGLPKDRFPKPKNFDIILDCENYDYDRDGDWESDSLSPSFRSIMNIEDEF